MCCYFFQVLFDVLGYLLVSELEEAFLAVAVFAALGCWGGCVCCGGLPSGCLTCGKNFDWYVECLLWVVWQCRFGTVLVGGKMAPACRYCGGASVGMLDKK